MTSKSLDYLKELMTEFKSSDASILMYGCNGYTATLILQLLKDLDFPTHQFVFAARNPVSLTEALVKNLGDEYSKIRVVTFSVTESEVKRILEKEKFSVVLNCAGPFSETAPVFIPLCASYGVSYVDITGEVSVFEFAHNNPSLKHLVGMQQIVILPGAGYDVVPSDCLLKTITDEYTKEYGEKPGKLEIMIVQQNRSSGVTISHGTKKTMVRGMLTGKSLTRINGKLDTPVDVYKPFPIRFRKNDEPKLMLGSSLPWGDISTGFYSTGVPNIHTFMPGLYPNKFIANLMTTAIIGILLRVLISLPFVLRIVDWRINKADPGPTEDARKNNRGVMYAIATSKDGKTFKTMYLSTKEGYQLTAETALASTLRIAMKKVNAFGSLTPSMAFGSDYILNFDESEFFE